MQIKFNCIFLLFLLIVMPLSLVGCRAAASPQAQERDILDELTFLGDSTTAHMQQRAPLRPEQIWATKDRYLNLDPRITYARIVAPDTKREETVAEVAARLKPRYLVITLGVDYGVFYYRDKPQTFRLYYEKLLNVIQATSPDTKLILQSIFPVAKGSAVITNDMIQSANGVIADIARDRGLLYVDQTATLCDGEGYLRPEYCYSEDGIHLTASAYKAILTRLKSMESEICAQ